MGKKYIPPSCTPIRELLDANQYIRLPYTAPIKWVKIYTTLIYTNQRAPWCQSVYKASLHSSIKMGTKYTPPSFTPIRELLDVNQYIRLPCTAPKKSEKIYTTPIYTKQRAPRCQSVYKASLHSSNKMEKKIYTTLIYINQRAPWCQSVYTASLHSSNKMREIYTPPSFTPIRELLDANQYIRLPYTALIKWETKIPHYNEIT